MGKKSGPPAPDYAGAAEATAASNKENLTQQTWANRADQNTPWGSLTWNSSTAVDPSTGQNVTRWTQNTTLDPRLQQAVDSQIDMQNQRSQLAGGLMGRVESEFSQPMQWGNAQQWGGVPQAGSMSPQGIDTSRMATPGLQTSLNFSGTQGVQGSDQSRQRAEDAIYQSATSRLNPQWDQRQQQLQTQLANQGITQNSAAYTRAMDDFNRSRTDAYTQAQMNAITGAGAEAQRNQGMDLALRQQQVGEIGQQGNFANTAAGQAFQFGNAARDQQLAAQQAAFNQQSVAGQQNFGQQMQQSQYQNQLRQQQLAEQMQQRGYSLNEIQALLNGQQVSMPQFGSYSQAGMAAPTDYLGAANSQYQAGLNSYNAQQAGLGNLMGGAASIAGMMFSDKRVKADIRRLAKHPRGFHWYSYRYIGETRRRVGVIAQEVRRYAPELVGSVRGVLQVNYQGL